MNCKECEYHKEKWKETEENGKPKMEIHRRCGKVLRGKKMDNLWLLKW